MERAADDLQFSCIECIESKKRKKKKRISNINVVLCACQLQESLLEFVFVLHSRK